MHLKEIILDGFKSYATRTVVSDFDRSFNAITGLNGSGKSNVLDSICFVLGISNLSQVRASSLQELVYKGGQAGVTKATVTLVFDNGDTATSPVGYEKFPEITVTRQIVIGGRNKYLINGHVAPPARVQTLFHLVGLNVNNPHFLIMQGRITKVINMKPPELLSMIEEAAGTKMYENKKEAALKTIEKKARKVEEIDSLLNEKINPSLAKLEKERKHYMEWNQNNNELESHRRLVTAYDYHRAAQTLQEASDVRQRLGVSLRELDERLSELTHEKKQAEAVVKDLSKQRAELARGCDVDALEADAEELDRVVTKLSSQLSNQQAALASENDARNAIVASAESTAQSIKALEAEAAARTDDVRSAEAEEKRAAAAVESAETALLTGASQDGSASGTGSVVDQLEAAKREVSHSASEIDALRMRHKHLKAQHQLASDKLAKDRAAVRSLEVERKRAETAVNDAKLAVHELDFDANAAQAVSDNLAHEKVEAAKHREQVDALSARLNAFDFRFADPHPGFDRRRVRGTVGKLMHVRHKATARALEVVAGGRLYQVVVDTDATANDLLKHGRLTKRVTILPLNKISHGVLSEARLARAKGLEPQCELALHLIGYEEDVVKAMEHVFGRVLVCPDMASAQKVTFDSGVRTKSVTLDGDVYDPSGTLSGGSSSSGGKASALELLGDLNSARAMLDNHEKNIAKLSSQLEALDAAGKQHRRVCSELEIKEHEAELLAKRLASSAAGRLLQEVETLQDEIMNAIPQAMETAKKSLDSNQALVRKLEDQLVNAETAHQQAEKEAESRMEQIKATHKAARDHLQEMRNKKEGCEVQMETLRKELERLSRQEAEVLGPSVARLKTEVEKLKGAVESETDRLRVVQQRLGAEKEKMLESTSAISSARQSVEKCSEAIGHLSIEQTKMQSKLRESLRSQESAQALVSELEERHTWIQEDRERFGQEGTEYEFRSASVSAAREAVDTLQRRQEALSKKINKKAMHMFETAKDDYNVLVQKKRIIEQDKAKIESVIAGLDEKKLVALDRTWNEVNSSFGQIFSELLPGTSAKLEPPENKALSAGLEIRVAFGAVWKDSLSELSGGQRSLIALSLILAMLRFKPAPMYILDEVDAALDLSHTQNIGRMLRRHFSGSQFIVVSLKEGMFHNANVIFRTKFVDGVSTISRTVSENAQRGHAQDKSRRSSKLIDSHGDAVDKENMRASSANIVANTSERRKRRERP